MDNRGVFVAWCADPFIRQGEAVIRSDSPPPGFEGRRSCGKRPEQAVRRSRGEARRATRPPFGAVQGHDRVCGNSN